MALTQGSRLGAYEIVSRLGAVVQDPMALARFEREARAVATLSHPNILAIHDFSAEGGVAYTVSELLEGETLRARLADGRLPTRKAVEYGLQIVMALAAAHHKGIVHRDVKPDNIFVTRDGRVKVLDFGLAKAIDSTAAATQTLRPDETEHGTVMGTVGYMSPEQVRGVPVDHRADIFSFGAVLYEMLSGRRAFHGDCRVEIMNAILKEDPAEFELSAVPPPLGRIVRRCLEKQPEERFHSAHDLGIALESLGDSSSSGASALGNVAPRAGSYSLRTVLAMSAVTGVAVAMIGYFAALSFSAPVGSPQYERLTFRQGEVRSAKLAPDGNTIVYSASWEPPGRDMYSTRRGSPESLQLPFPNAQVASISSSGELAIIAARRGVRNWANVGTLSRAPLSGGAAREIIEDVQDADWLPDGSNLVASRYVGGQYELHFPIGTVVYRTGGWITHPRVSPDGQTIAFLNHPILGDDRGSLAVVDRAGHLRTLSAEYESAQGLAWRPDGREVWFTAASRGFSRSLQAATLAGAVRTVHTTPGILVLCDIAMDGTVLLVHEIRQRGIKGWVKGASEERDLSWHDWSGPAALSDDGQMLLSEENGDGGGRGYSVYLRKMDGSPAVRLGSGSAPALSPDGKWVLTLRTDSTPAQIQIIPTGTGEARAVTNDDITHLQLRFMPDGKRMLFIGFAPGQLWRESAAFC